MDFYQIPLVAVSKPASRRPKTRQSKDQNPPVKEPIPASHPKLVLAGINRASGGSEPSSTPKRE